MDDIDREIVRILQTDVTLSVREIAEIVGLTPTPCWRRLQNLEANNVIKARVALINPEAVNLSLTAPRGGDTVTADLQAQNGTVEPGPGVSVMEDGSYSKVLTDEEARAGIVDDFAYLTAGGRSGTSRVSGAGSIGLRGAGPIELGQPLAYISQDPRRELSSIEQAALVQAVGPARAARIAGDANLRAMARAQAGGGGGGSFGQR